jgi:hypothetical protein
MDHEVLCTTGICNCTQCQKHSVQDRKHSVQIVPSATLGTMHSEQTHSVQIDITLGKCATLGTENI